MTKNRLITHDAPLNPKLLRSSKWKEKPGILENYQPICHRDSEKFRKNPQHMGFLKVKTIDRQIFIYVLPFKRDTNTT